MHCFEAGEFTFRGVFVPFNELVAAFAEGVGIFSLEVSGVEDVFRDLDSKRKIVSPRD